MFHYGLNFGSRLHRYSKHYCSVKLKLDDWLGRSDVNVSAMGR